MKRLAIIALAALSLASCSTTDTVKIDAAIQKNLPTACAGLNAAHAAFSAFAVTGKVKEKTVAREQAAYAGVRVICANPGNATAATALVSVVQAYVIVSAALKEAQAAS